MDAITTPPRPSNEPVHSYAPGSPERARIVDELALQSHAGHREFPHIIGGHLSLGAGEEIDVVQPHAHREVLGFITNATHDDARAAVDAARAAWSTGWQVSSLTAGVYLQRIP